MAKNIARVDFKFEEKKNGNWLHDTQILPHFFSLVTVIGSQKSDVIDFMVSFFVCVCFTFVKSFTDFVN